MLVVGGGGALLREGIEATSAKLRVLPRGSRVRRLEAAEDGRGKRRLRVAADGADGWLSEALVEAELAADDGWPEVAEAPPWAPGDSLAPFLTTPVAFLDEALADVAGVGPADVVVDLGCGDGRIPVWARRHGARRCGGVELDGSLVDVARANVAARRLADVVDIVHGDLTADDDPRVAALLEAATLLTVFLLPEAEPAVEPIVRRHVARGGRALFLGWLPRGYESDVCRTLGADTGRGLDAYLVAALPTGDALAPSLRLLHSPEERSEFGGDGFCRRQRGA